LDEWERTAQKSLELIGLSGFRGQADDQSGRNYDLLLLGSDRS
jgi:hypothetical protein